MIAIEKTTAITELPLVTRIRLRAQRRILWIHNLWSTDLTGIPSNLAISPSEIDRILGDRQQLAQAEAAFYQNNPIAQQLSQQIHLADDRATHDRAWQQLVQTFALSEWEQDLLSLAIAVALDPLLRRVYGYLHDDATMGYATPWLANILFQWNSVTSWSTESTLVRWRLAYPVEGSVQSWSMIASWIADPFIVSWLTLNQQHDPALGMAAQWIATAQLPHQPCLYPAQLEAIQAFVQVIVPNIPLEIELVAPSGSGKRTLAMQLCQALGRNLLTVDASLLLSPDLSPSLAIERVLRAVRLAKLTDAVLYWHGVTEVLSKVWQGVLSDMALTVFSVTTPLVERSPGIVHRAFHLPALTRTQRIELWHQLCDRHPVPDPVLNWVLTPGEITAAAKVAPAGTQAITDVCRQLLHYESGELFTPLFCPYTWEDIVLPAAVREHLAELEQQARLRWLVYEEWGFERLTPMGRGITAMFAGPSGTGKTMAAQVLARSLGVELYRVDLAGVINKYIGETEKRLKQVFDSCERANVLLFFDEADALFGQRTQVKDAHDRFANIEIDYLLQRMEQFDGIAILATNRKGDLDQAFLRRIRFIIDFMSPSSTERLALWKLALPERSPKGEELLDRIDWEFLANKLTMTGADIKSAALGAAFLARSQGTRITMQHVLHAARREMAKHGGVLRSGEWE